VGADGSGALETSGIIDASLEGQCGDIADPGRSHQALTDSIPLGHFAGSVIEFTKGSIQHQPGLTVEELGVGLGDSNYYPGTGVMPLPADSAALSGG
jgi:hypothetical protein